MTSPHGRRYSSGMVRGVDSLSGTEIQRATEKGKYYLSRCPTPLFEPPGPPHGYSVSQYLKTPSNHLQFKFLFARFTPCPRRGGAVPGSPPLIPHHESFFVPPAIHRRPSAVRQVPPDPGVSFRRILNFPIVSSRNHSIIIHR